METIVIGDLQLKRENKHLAKKLFELVESTTGHKIWMGDLLDRRGNIEVDCLNMLYDYFSTSTSYHIVIVGNHDLINLHSKEHALHCLSGLSNVVIVDRPTAVGNIIAMPYYKNPEEFKADLALMYEKDKFDYLFCHQGIKEFTINSGYTESEAIALSDVKQFKKVIAGHYHTPNERDNVIYIGSPFSHSFGESNEVKRLLQFDTESGIIKEMPMTIFPKHMTYEWNATMECAKELKDCLPYPFNDFNRVLVSGDAETVAYIQELAKTRPDIRWQFQIQSADDKEATIEESITNSEKFSTWAKDIKNLDEETINLGLEVLKSVS